MNLGRIIQLDIPKEYKNEPKKLEEYYRQKFIDIKPQIRLYGLGYGRFPYKERYPYISIFVDGSSYVVGANFYAEPS